MIVEVKVNELPESVADGTLVAWHKQPGDEVKADEPLAEIETDKVVLEIAAPGSGIVGPQLRKKGETGEARGCHHDHRFVGCRFGCHEIQARRPRRAQEGDAQDRATAGQEIHCRDHRDVGSVCPRASPVTRAPRQRALGGREWRGGDGRLGPGRAPPSRGTQAQPVRRCGFRPTRTHHQGRRSPPPRTLAPARGQHRRSTNRRGNFRPACRALGIGRPGVAANHAHQDDPPARPHRRAHAGSPAQRRDSDHLQRDQHAGADGLAPQLPATPSRPSTA